MSRLIIMLILSLLIVPQLEAKKIKPISLKTLIATIEKQFETAELDTVTIGGSSFRKMEQNRITALKLDEKDIIFVYSSWGFPKFSKVCVYDQEDMHRMFFISGTASDSTIADAVMTIIACRDETELDSIDLKESSYILFAKKGCKVFQGGIVKKPSALETMKFEIEYVAKKFLGIILY